FEPTDDDDDWEAVNLLTTAPEIWSESNELEGEIQFDEAKDVDGPLTIAVALTREIDSDTPTEQRILVLGDGDFVSNTFVGNGGNLELSLRMLNWLVQDDAFIEIPVQTTDDTKLTFSPTIFNFIAIFFVIILPVSLLITGMFVWLKRRKA
ncbi:MAG: ABC transporter, partial [Thiotrichaceae bacterium]|nr:ABC transporter [Thiotrichaceae bacterium]